MRDTNTEELKTKILVNIYSPLILLMKKKFDAACLKRDAYLDLVFKYESEFLMNEIPQSGNSGEIKDYISKNIKKLNTTPVNFYLSKETIRLINTACEKRNVPRDAFFNRVILLLTASWDVIHVLFPAIKSTWIDNEGKRHTHDVRTDAIFEPTMKRDEDEQYFFVRANVPDTLEKFVNNSPFWLLRKCIAYINDYIETGDTANKHPNLYSYAFPSEAFSKLPEKRNFLKIDNVIGFNTFMDDESAIYAADDDQLDLLDELFAIHKKEAKETIQLMREKKDLF